MNKYYANVSVHTLNTTHTYFCGPYASQQAAEEDIQTARGIASRVPNYTVGHSVWEGTNLAGADTLPKVPTTRDEVLNLVWDTGTKVTAQKGK